MPLKHQWPLVWSLLSLLPFSSSLALPATNGTLWQHLLWPLVHANILHWFINTFCFMALWRMVTVSRLLWAYAASILIGYLWCAILNSQWSTFNETNSSFFILHSSFSILHSSFFILHSSLKLCGLSSIIFFLLGILFTRCTRTYRIRLTILIIISCFIPNIAASVHIASLFAGILYAKLSVLWHRHNSSRPVIFYCVAAGFVGGLLSVASGLLSVDVIVDVDVISVAAGFVSGLLSVDVIVLVDVISVAAGFASCPMLNC